jgi:hypothetical protein
MTGIGSQSMTVTMRDVLNSSRDFFRLNGTNRKELLVSKDSHLAQDMSHAEERI